MNPGEWRFETRDGWKSVNLKETEGGFIAVEVAGVRYATTSSTPIGAIHACCRHAFDIQPWEIWEIRGPGEPTYGELRRENSDLHQRVNDLAAENRALAEGRGRFNETFAACLRAFSRDRSPEVQEMTEEVCRLLGVPRAP